MGDGDPRRTRRLDAETESRERARIIKTTSRCHAGSGSTTYDEFFSNLLESRLSLPAALAAVRGLAAGLFDDLYILPAACRNLIHTHAADLFAGTRDDGIVERREPDGSILHAAEEVFGAGTVPWWRRSAAQARFARHVERERPLREAERAVAAGRENLEERDLEGAQGRFASASHLAPGWALPHYLLGCVQLHRGDASAAIDALELAERLRPGVGAVREYLDTARRLADGRIAFDAFRWFERASAAEPSEPSEPDTVIALCRRAVELSPDFPAARLALGRAHASKQEHREALKELRLVLDAGPDMATLCHALVARGTIFLNRGLTEQAHREFQQVIEIDGSPAATRMAMECLASGAAVH